jgi:hypothetical protein
MKEHDLTQSKAILENPVTLKLFIFVKSKNPESVGIREAMKATEMSSSSTASRHLDKLEEHNLIQKLPSNRFTLTSEGLKMRSFDVPITVPAYLVKGNFVTVLSYQLTFIVIMINYTEESSQNKLQVSPNIFKILSLVSSGLTGLFAFGIMGIYIFPADAGYLKMMQINSIVGYICAACALITIVITVIFKNNNLVFMISTFITAILGSLLIVIFVAYTRYDVFSHYQYVVPLFTSILSISFFFLYIFLTKRRKKE